MCKITQAGYDAAKNNQSIHSNPYQEGDKYYELWRNGYLEYMNQWY